MLVTLITVPFTFQTERCAGIKTELTKQIWQHLTCAGVLPNLFLNLSYLSSFRELIGNNVSSHHEILPLLFFFFFFSAIMEHKELLKVPWDWQIGKSAAYHFSGCCWKKRTDVLYVCLHCWTGSVCNTQSKTGNKMPCNILFTGSSVWNWASTVGLGNIDAFPFELWNGQRAI